MSQTTFTQETSQFFVNSNPNVISLKDLTDVLAIGQHTQTGSAALSINGDIDFPAQDTVIGASIGANTLTLGTANTNVNINGFLTFKTDRGNLNQAVGSGGSGTPAQWQNAAVGSLPAYDDDAAAGVGGLTAGQYYQTTGAGAAPLNAAGIVMIKQ
jgi:hypothetical protein